MAAQWPADPEVVCQAIEWLELYRQCIDEALADGYAELTVLVGDVLPTRMSAQARPQGRHAHRGGGHGAALTPRCPYAR
jgi:hypothetical protein